MTDTLPSFEDLGLNSNILKALKSLGYETPSPIQAKTIPSLLDGRDVLGQAQTGTGKTAAFALPILQQVNLRQKAPQVLVLAPTRELAIQVAEAFQSYAKYMTGFQILPIYGGQGYDAQIRGIRRGAQIIVGTPGRVMDHMRKGTLDLSKLTHLVLDEADEMLRMGFIDDVEWVLEKVPKERQIALFSATMPKVIAKVAEKYLVNPVKVQIKLKTTTASTIRQRYWPVGGLHKLDALTRIFEVEPFDAMIIFVRTKTATAELAEKLEARGYSAAALNGDINQSLRERTIDRLKKGQIDVLVATDVAARGLDVERISHVVNYDIPYDTEAYVHRIGRTGRAGRSGEAILFVARREMRMLASIEKATGQKIEPMTLPSISDVNAHRITRFKQEITESRKAEDLSYFTGVLMDYQQETGAELLDIAAAVARMAQGSTPLLLNERAVKEPRSHRDSDDGQRRNNPRRDRDKKQSKRKFKDEPEEGMQTYRIEVGRADGAAPGNIVGAIANEANLDSRNIGRIKLYDNYSTVDLPTTLAKAALKTLKKTRVCQKQLDISLMKDGGSGGGDDGEREPKKRKSGKKKSNG